VEFAAAVTRVKADDGLPLLSFEGARREAGEFLSQFNATVVRTAIRGAAAYQLSWFDAHPWAYAEHYGLGEIWFEDFQPNRLYGSVRVRDPFAAQR